MNFIKRFIQTYKKLKELEKSDARKIAEMLLNDPLSIETLSILARDCGRAFEVIRPSDGVVFRFYKHGSEPIPQDDRDAW